MRRAESKERVSHIVGSHVNTGVLLIARFLNSHYTDYAMGTIIVLNMGVMIIEIDRGASEEDNLSNKVHWTEYCGYAVLLIFVIELLLRLVAFQWNFFKDGWNIFDFAIVLTDAIMFFVSLVGADFFPVSILRIFRLSKLARVSKILRVFPELRMMLASLVSSFSTIFWGACMLFLFLLVWAMVAVLLIHPLNKDVEYDGCERCPRAYGSVMDAALTFWQQIVAGDSWGQATIPLIEKHPITAVFFVPLFLSVGLALMNLILGVVVTVAQQKKDDLEAIEKSEDTMIELEKRTGFLALCKQMDRDASGTLSQSELYAGFEEHGAFREKMHALGITKDDFDVVWAMLDIEQSGSVSYDRLVRHVYGLRDSSSDFTLAYLKYHVTHIRDMLLNYEHAVTLKDQLEEELNKIENKEDVLLKRQEELLEKLEVAPIDERNQKHQAQAKDDQAVIEVHDVKNGITKDMQELDRFDAHLRSYDAFCDELVQQCGFDRKSAQEEWHRRRLLPDKYQQRLDKHGCVSIELDIEAFKKHLETLSTEALVNEDMQSWLSRVTREISMMRVDMKDMMRKVDRDFISRELPLITQQGRMNSSSSHYDLLVVPDKSSSSCSLLRGC